MSGGILVIGAGGFVGTALSARLLQEGETVHRLQRTPAPSSGPNDRVHIASLDDAELLHAILPACDRVVHLASSSTPASTANAPVLEAELNLMPTLRLLELLREHPQARLVFASSGGTLYGNPGLDSASEGVPLETLSCHGAGKLAAEAFLQAFHHQTGRDVTVLRPSNLYGPGQALRSGFGLIRNMLEHARRGSALQIWGDGESVRDFLYIDDMVEACIRVLRGQTGGWRVFNVGAGVGHSVNEIRTLVEAVTGVTIPAVRHPARAGDVRRIVLDSRKLQDACGWRPSVTLLQGVERTWHWLKDQPL